MIKSDSFQGIPVDIWFIPSVVLWVNITSSGSQFIRWLTLSLTSFINDVIYSCTEVESGPSSEYLKRKSVIALIVDIGIGAKEPLFMYIFFLTTGKSLRISSKS